MKEAFRKLVAPTYQRFNEQFSKLSFRERVLFAAVFAGVLLFIIDQTLILRMTDERTRTKRSIELTRTAIDSTQASINQLNLNQMSAEDREIAEEIDQLRLQVQEIERQMQSTVESLVPPDAIVSVLEELLAPSRNLRLVSLRSHAPEPITSGSQESAAGEEVVEADPDAVVLYRHGLTLEIEGGYADTTDYLERIESSPWHLLWERFEYEVGEYPEARIRIDLHTISDQEEWIGV